MRVPTAIWARLRQQGFEPMPRLSPDAFVGEVVMKDEMTAFLKAAAARISRARRLIAEGADVLDVGGESTRPDAEPVFGGPILNWDLMPGAVPGQFLREVDAVGPDDQRVAALQHGMRIQLLQTAR